MNVSSNWCAGQRLKVRVRVSVRAVQHSGCVRITRRMTAYYVDTEPISSLVSMRLNVPWQRAGLWT